MREKIKYWLFQKGKNCRRCCLRCEYYDICSWGVKEKAKRVRRIKRIERKFYKEYMRKSRPKAPLCICKNALYSWLGIVSPSLCWFVKTGGKGVEAAELLEEYEKNTARYMCYRRTLTKEQWKTLYREYRKARRKNEKL